MAVRALLRRHANLRAGFLHQGLDEPVQIIPREVALPWQEVDLASLDRDTREAELVRILTEDGGRRFDPTRPPLLRFSLIRLAAETHRLVITKHHILLDGWSMPILLHELFVLYHARGDAGALPPVTPYRDYLALLKARDRSDAESAWRNALTGLEEPTRIAPARSTAQTDPERIVINFSRELTGSLVRQARSHGLTLNTVVQGAWGILLSRLTGRDDIVFGITIADRPPELPGVERMVGLLINTLPLRLQIRAGELIVALLSRLQEQQARLMPYQHLGLSDIQRLAGFGELFDTLLVFENYPIDQGGLQQIGSGLRITRAGGRGGDTSHYPLGLVVLPGSQLQLRLGYRPDLFDRATVEALGARLVRLFEAIASDPLRPVGGIEILAPAERAQLLEEWNDTAHAVPVATLPELFEAQAARTPDAVALVFEDTALSYAELNTRANQLAHLLIGEGVGPESIVALALPRSLEMVVGLLGILKAGGAYLPLDPDYPAERLAFMLEDARPLRLISTGAVAAQLPAGVPLLRLDAAETISALVGAAGHNPTDTDRRAPLRPYNPAYVTYTSGSTGKPKGVMGLHAGAVNRLEWFDGAYPYQPGRPALAKSSLSFIDGSTELLGPLLHGAQIVTGKFPGEQDTSGHCCSDWTPRDRFDHACSQPDHAAD